MKSLYLKDLEVGMKVAIQHPVSIGWNTYTGLNQYGEYTVVRVTPKKAKAVLDNGVSTVEVTKTMRCKMYASDDETQAEDRKAKLFLSLRADLENLEDYQEGFAKLSLDDLKRAKEMTKTLVEMRGDGVGR